VKRAGLVSIAALFFATSALADSIDNVVARCGGPLWLNGAYPILNLPSTASTKEVTAKVFAMTDFVGKGASFQILKNRQVHIRGASNDYTAVLIRTGSRDAVILLRFGGNDWWSRLFTVNSHGMPEAD
jgi:hypothetical protein